MQLERMLHRLLHRHLLAKLNTPQRTCKRTCSAIEKHETCLARLKEISFITAYKEPMQGERKAFPQFLIHISKMPIPVLRVDVHEHFSTTSSTTGLWHLLFKSLFIFTHTP